jgi:hypothetical protein
MLIFICVHENLDMIQMPQIIFVAVTYIGLCQT